MDLKRISLERGIWGETKAFFLEKFPIFSMAPVDILKFLLKMEIELIFLFFVFGQNASEVSAGDSKVTRIKKRKDLK